VTKVFLKNVAFKDFRTFGKFAVEITPAPGLTLLVGTNGLGKSNFFDGLEWGITGEVRRLAPFMRSGDEARVLTRRGAQPGSHSVRLAFTGDQAITRGPRDKPASSAIVQLLKRERWTADIDDIGTYLAFTHFLGQAAQRRFTSREPTEQWRHSKALAELRD
jgi:predicted ATPase